MNRRHERLLALGLAALLSAAARGAGGEGGEGGEEGLLQTPQQLRVAGQAALEDGLYTLAEKYFGQYIRKAGDRADRAEGVVGLARALCGQGRYADAMALLRNRAKWAAGTPWAAAFAFWEARALFELGAYEDALRVLGAAEAAPPDNPWRAPAVRLRAKCHVKLGELDRAVELFSRAREQALEPAEEAQHLLDWAGALILLGRKEEAVGLLEDLAARHGSCAAGQTGRLWLAEMRVEQGRRDDAAAVFRELGGEETAPPDLRARAWYGVAEACEAQTNYNEALSAVEQGVALAAAPEVRARGQLLRSRLLVAVGRLEEGAALLHEWAVAHPRDPLVAGAQLELAQSLLDRGEFARAEKEFQYYLETFADEEGRSKALLGKGWSLFETKRYAEAAAAFEKAYALSRNEAEKSEALFKAADAYFAGEQYKLAREKYAEVARMFPGNPLVPQALFQAAECLARLGDPAAETELRAIEDAFAESPAAEQAAMRIARLKEEQGRWEDALAAYRRVMKNYPQGRMYARALHGSALIRYRLGQFAKALKAFEQIQRDFPASEVAEQAFYMRGWCLYLMGQSEEALAVCREFLTKYPGSAWAPDVLFWLAEYHYNRGDYAEAERRFVELADTYAGGSLTDEAVFWAGRAAMAQKEYRRAIEHFNRLTQAFPGSPLLPEARFLQGDALSELGQFSGAVVAFEEVIKKHAASYLADLAWGRKGDCQFTLGTEDPHRYEEALESYRAVLNRPSAAADLKLQAEYKIGRCQEKMGRAAEAFERYMNVVYTYLSNCEKGEIGGALWFTRAAFGAAGLKEAEGRWREALSIYERVVEAGLPASEDARQRIQKLQLEQRAAL